MKIKKGDKLTVNCCRKGTYLAVAAADFDTDEDEWFSVLIDQAKPVSGMSKAWHKGDPIPCRNGHATITKR